MGSEIHQADYESGSNGDRRAKRHRNGDHLGEYKLQRHNRRRNRRGMRVFGGICAGHHGRIALAAEENFPCQKATVVVGTDALVTSIEGSR